MSLRIFAPPIFHTSIPHVRTATTTHRRAAANGRPPLLKNMPRRVKRPETRQKKMYWKKWWVKHTTTRELTAQQIEDLEQITVETTRRVAADGSTTQHDTDVLAHRLESNLNIGAMCDLAPEPTSNEPQSIRISTTLPYSVSRTGTGNLPTYQLTKAGGSLLQTRIRRVEGLSIGLKDELAQWLQPPPPWLRVNTVNGHIEMKGWYKDQVDKYLLAKGF